MFENSTIEAVRDCLSALKPLNAKPNTIISALNQQLGLAGIPAGTEPAQQLDLIEQRARAQDDEPNHTTSMSQAVQIAAASARQTLDLVRNVVNPHLREVIQRHDTYLAQFKEAACSPYQIVRIETPDIYKDPIIDDILDANASRLKISLVDQRVVIGHYDREAIMRLLVLTEERDINAQLRELLSENGGVGVNKIISVLSGHEAISGVLRHHPTLALPMYIILNAIDMPTEGVNSTAATWELNRRQLLTNCVSVIEQVRARFENTLKYNVLYDLTSPVRNPEEIRVNAEVYVRMLEDGFSANALIGNEILRRPYTKADDLLKNIKALEEAYAREQLILNQAFQVKQQTHRLQSVVNAIRDDIKARVDAGNFVLEGDSAEKVNARAKVLLERVTTGANKSSDSIILLMAALIGIWYAHTDAARYCDYMIEVELENPSLKGQPMEINTLATVRYVVAFARSMVEVG